MRGWLTTVSGREPADATLNVAVWQGGFPAPLDPPAFRAAAGQQTRGETPPLNLAGRTLPHSQVASAPTTKELRRLYLPAGSGSSRHTSTWSKSMSS